MTNGILSTVEDWTGSYPLSCPWRPFMNDPLTRAVLDAWEFFQKGTLALFRPRPSYRLMMGLRCFSQAMSDIHAEQLALDKVSG